MSEPLFSTDTYDTILTVRPFGEPLDDWLLVDIEDRRNPENPEEISRNALRREEIVELRDVLDTWLEDHPERPDPFAHGGSVRFTDAAGEEWNVSIVGESHP